LRSVKKTIVGNQIQKQKTNIEHREVDLQMVEHAYVHKRVGQI